MLARREPSLLDLGCARRVTSMCHRREMNHHSCFQLYVERATKYSRFLSPAPVPLWWQAVAVSPIFNRFSCFVRHFSSFFSLFFFKQIFILSNCHTIFLIVINANYAHEKGSVKSFLLFYIHRKIAFRIII